jgi:HEAT repeat protein
MLFSRRSFSALLVTGLVLILGPSARAQDEVSYPPFDQRCVESQIKAYVLELNEPDRADFVSIALRFCKQRADSMLNKFLMSQDSDLRTLAAYGWALTHDDKEKVTAILVTALKDENASIRLRSAYALGQVVGNRNRYSTDVRDVPPSAVLALSESLTDRESSVRRMAALSLIELGQKSSMVAVALVEALKDRDPLVRSKAARGLGEVGRNLPSTSPAASELIRLLADSDERVRRTAAKALGEIARDAAAAVPPLRKALKDSDVEVRTNAAEALGEFGTEATSAIPDLTAVLVDSGDELNMWTADTVTDSLVKIGKASVPDLMVALANKNNRAPGSVIGALGDLGGDARSAVPLLIPLLANKNLGSIAAWAVGRIAKEAKEIIPVLLAATRNQDPTVRSNARYGLLALGPDTRRVIPFFISALKKSGRDIRSEAISALGKFGMPAVPALIEALHDDDPGVRAGAALAFWHMARANPNIIPYQAIIIQQTIPVLRAALSDREDVVRFRANLALQELSPDGKGAPRLPPAALNDEDESIREKAVLDLIGTDPALNDRILSVLVGSLKTRRQVGENFNAAFAFKKFGKEAIPALITALKDPDPQVRSFAVYILRDMGADARAAVPALINALTDKDPGVHTAAANTLDELKLNINAASPLLILALQTWEKDDRRTAVNCLIRIGADAVPALNHALEDRNADVRAAAANAMQGMGRNAKAGVPALSRTLKDPEPNVRSAVVQALDQISFQETSFPNKSNELGDEFKSAIPGLIQMLKDEDVEIRYDAAIVLRRIVALDVPALISALKDENAKVRKGAAYALGGLKIPPTAAVTALKSLVEDEKEDLEVRRVAASILEEFGLDMESFFAHNNLLSPKNAGCPGLPFNGGTEYFKFSIYTGRCEDAGYGGPLSGGSSLFDYVKKLFGGK